MGTCQAKTVEEFLDLEMLDKALQVRACNLITSTMQAYDESDAPAMVKDNEIFYTAKITMLRAHMRYL